VPDESRRLNAYLSNPIGIRIIIQDVEPADEKPPKVIRQRDGHSQLVPPGFEVAIQTDPPPGWVID